MIRTMGVRPIIFSVNCYIATILTMFIAFSLDLKSPGWAMTTVYLTSQPLSGVLRAKAVYRVIGTFVGGAAMVAIVPNLIDAPELTTLAIILWVALCVFVSLLDRTPRSYMFVLSGYTAALIGFPSVLAPGTVFDTAVSRVEEITLGVVCAAIVHSLIFPKSAFSAFGEKLTSAMADARRWLADGLVQQATPQAEMERRRIAADINELYLLGTSLRFDTSPHRPDIGIIRAFDRKIVALLPLVSAIEDRLTAAAASWAAGSKAVAGVGRRSRLAGVESPGRPTSRSRAQGSLCRRDACRRSAIKLGRSRDNQLDRAPDRTDRVLASLPRLCRLSRRSDADAERRYSRRGRADRAETDAYGSGHRVVVGAGGRNCDGPVRLLLDRDRMAGRRRRSRLCCSGLHAVCIFGRSDTDPAQYHHAFGFVHSDRDRLSVLYFAGDRRFRAVMRRACLHPDPGRTSVGYSGLCTDRAGARLGLLCRDEPANELHGRSCDHHQYQQRLRTWRRGGRSW